MNCLRNLGCYVLAQSAGTHGTNTSKIVHPIFLANCYFFALPGQCLNGVSHGDTKKVVATDGDGWAIAEVSK